jgi:hypothetical protein
MHMPAHRHMGAGSAGRQHRSAPSPPWRCGCASSAGRQHRAADPCGQPATAPSHRWAWNGNAGKDTGGLVRDDDCGGCREAFTAVKWPKIQYLERNFGLRPWYRRGGAAQAQALALDGAYAAGNGSATAAAGGALPLPIRDPVGPVDTEDAAEQGSAK